jgi:Ca-activated chloride channel family protein
VSFEHPLVLAGAPLALAWLFFAFRARRGARALGPRIERRFAGARRLSARPQRRTRLRGGLAALGALLGVAALAGPQWGSVVETSVERSREVLIALDLSRSMLGEDVAPSRLERAKLLVSSLLDELPGEQVGLVVFAGTAFLQSPLSSDHEVLRELLAELGPGYLPQGGTDYGAMLRAAVSAFGRERRGDRTLVVLSDGEAHDEGWRELVPSVAQAGIRAIALGVGTREGAVIPRPQGGLVKDERGAAVLSRLEPGTLEALARETGGVYRDAASWIDVAALIDATVAQGTAGVHVEERGLRPQQRYQWLLAPAFACWLLAFWRELPAHPLRRRLAATGAALAAALGLAGVPQPALAAAATSAAPASPASALEAAVAELAAQFSLSARDYARLAEQTLAYGEQAASARSPALEGVVDDALLGVELGERESPDAADWPELRRRLAALKQRQEQEPQQQEPQQPPEEPQETQPSQQQEQQEQGADAQPQGASADREQPPQQDRTQEPQPGQGAAQDRQQAQQPQQGGAGSRSPGAASDAGEPGDTDQDRAAEEPEPIAEPEAGLAALDERSDAPDPEDARDGESAGASAAQEPLRRLGGGGGVEAPEAGSPELVEASSRQQGVRDGDRPGVLFQRMQRSAGRERPESRGKNW